MPSIVTDLISDIPRLVGLTIALSGAIVALTAYRRRPRPTTYSGVNRESTAVPRPVGYHPTPTIRLPESQRIDRLRKIARLAPGEHVDVLENPGLPGVAPRFRITLKSIIRTDDGSTAAHIAVEFGGTAVSCGPLVAETAFNEFVLPRATRDESRNSVFHYQEQGDSLSFMRIRLSGIDMDADIAEIDVMQMAGHWPV